MRDREQAEAGFMRACDGAATGTEVATTILGGRRERKREIEEIKQSLFGTPQHIQENATRTKLYCTAIDSDSHLRIQIGY